MRIRINQLTVMCTNRGEGRLISIRCLKECVESKVVISCGMMHNLIKIYHVVLELLEFSLINHERTDSHSD